MKKNKQHKSLNDLAAKGRVGIFVVDETEYWREDIKELAGKIECVYMVNLGMPTHCCELAVSFPAIALRNFVHNSEAFNEDYLTELENFAGIDYEVKYFSGNSCMKLVKMY
jgi:hypothetical protein